MRKIAAALAVLALTACGANESYPEETEPVGPSYSEQVSQLCAKLDAEYVELPYEMCVRDGEIVYPQESE